jgi:hypothetical protein
MNNNKNKDNKAPPRVLFLALDSAEPELIRKWCDDGSLRRISA